MTDRSNGGAAFPCAAEWGAGEAPFVQEGMSLRDWFAGQALAGIAGPAGDSFSLSPQDSADWAYQYADAMLAAREGRKDG